MGEIKTNIEILASNILKQCEIQGLTIEETLKLPALLKREITLNVMEQHRKVYFKTSTHPQEDS